MNKERAVYMQTLKRKCSLAKNPSKQEVQAYSACALNHYNGSRLKPMDDKQAKCSKKNCDHLIQFGGKHAKEIQTRRSGQRTRRRRGGTHYYYNTSQFSRLSGRPSRHSINSANAKSRASLQHDLFAKQHVLNDAQKRLVNDLAEQVIQLEASKGENRNHVIGKLLNELFSSEEIDKKILYHALIMIAIASLVASKGHHKPKR
jgi:hypothetical protein